MLLGRPAILDPRALELRPLIGTISNIRQRIEAIEAAVNTNTQVAATSAAASASGAQLHFLRSLVEALDDRVGVLEGGGGGGSTSDDVTLTAAADIAAFAPVVASGPEIGIAADASDSTAWAAVIGVAIASAAAGSPVTVRRRGMLEDITGAVFEIGQAVYVGDLGLTQSPTYETTAIPVGVATGVDSMWVSPDWGALLNVPFASAADDEFLRYLPVTWRVVALLEDQLTALEVALDARLDVLEGPAAAALDARLDALEGTVSVPSTFVPFGTGAGLTSSANFFYTVGTNTISFGSVIGSALSMTIRPKTPSVVEDAGALNLLAQNAVKANSNGGAIAIQSGAKTGTGAHGAINLAVGTSGVGMSLADTGVNFVGAGGESFGSLGNWLFSGPSSPTTDDPILFVAGINTAVTGNTPIQFLTDSGVILELAETTFGVPELAFFGAAPSARPTTADGSATFVANAGTTVNAASTFDGYTIRQIVLALRTLGILT